MPAWLVKSPDDVLLFMAHSLERDGRKVFAGADVDLRPIWEGVPAGSDYAFISTQVSQAHRQLHWIKPDSNGLGAGYELTDIGVARLEQIRLDPARLAKAAQLSKQAWSGGPRRLQRTVAEEMERMHGSVGGSRWALLLHRLVEDEAKARAGEILGIYERAFPQVGSSVSDDFRTAVVDSAKIMMVESRDEFLKVFGRSQPIGKGWALVLDDVTQSVVDDVAYRAEMASLGSAPPAERTTSTMFNFHGPVGAVQTGEGASASVTQNIEADFSAAQPLLLELKQLIDATEKRDELARAAVSTLADELIREVESRLPNRMTMVAKLQGIALLIQTADAIPGAINLVKRISSAIGFP